MGGVGVEGVMGKGYGFGGEGDWKRGGVEGLLKVMSDDESRGFMEE